MKAKVSMAGLAALALAGCNLVSHEDEIENSITHTLAGDGNVVEVEMTRQDENNLTGFAVVRGRDGRDRRLNCTARRTEGANYDWRCLQPIDETLIQEIEGQIRSELEQRATVLEVDMSRQDDNNMTGFARLQDAAGNEIRTNCTATRNLPGNGNLSWRCSPGEAPAGGEAAPTLEGEKPSE